MTKIKLLGACGALALLTACETHDAMGDDMMMDDMSGDAMMEDGMSGDDMMDADMMADEEAMAAEMMDG